MSDDRDYVLGTHDEEIARLGLQHRVWRPAALEAWRRAGISAGSRVLDVGAGPGYATADLSEIVGPDGEVIGIERSARFLKAAAALCERRGLKNVRLREADLMADALPAEQMDAAWCRWVASFVGSPATLVGKIGAALRPGGTAVFHEYADYGTWRFLPRRPRMEEFVREVMATWRASGGEPDVAAAVVEHLARSKLAIRHAAPILFCARPRDEVWSWPAGFVESGLDRLLDLKRVDRTWVDSVRREFRAAEADPGTLMVTPMVLEIIAVRAE